MGNSVLSISAIKVSYDFEKTVGKKFPNMTDFISEMKENR